MALQAPRLLALACALGAAASSLSAEQTTQELRLPEPIGGEIPVAADGGPPAVAALANGGYVVVWRDPDGSILRARRFDAGGDRLGATFVVGPAVEAAKGLVPYERDFGPAAVGLDGERWAVAWVEPNCTGCVNGVLLSLYDGATPIFERRTVATDPDHHRYRPVLAANGRDRLAVAWTADNGVPPPFPDGANFTDAFARILDFEGAPASAPFRVNEDTTDEQNLRDAAFLANGDLVFVWESYEGEGIFYDVYQRIFDDSGRPRGGESRVNGGEGQLVTQYEPAVAALDSGYVVVWTDWYTAPTADPTTTFNGTTLGRLYTLDGTPFGEEAVLSGTEPPGDRRAPRVAGNGDDFVVLWEHGCVFDVCDTHPDSPDGSRVGIFARSFAAFSFEDGSELLQVNLEGTGDQRLPAFVGAADGYLAAWISEEQAGTPDGPGPSRILARRFAEPACEGLCLYDGRFEVNVTWQDFRGRVGRGIPVVRGEAWGTFWFFGPDNVELTMKLLDGTGLNGHWWLFYASLTNVEYSLTVTDRSTRRSRTYRNPSGTFGSHGDTLALEASSVPPAAPAVTPALPAAPLFSSSSTGSPPPCDDGEICVADDRIRIELEWHDFHGSTGAASGAPLTGDTALLWFFDPRNPEVLVKVLDGRPVNGHYWVFYAALSNVGFTLRVTDRLTNETVTYENPIGSFASGGDITAFAVP